MSANNIFKRIITTILRIISKPKRNFNFKPSDALELEAAHFELEASDGLKSAALELEAALLLFKKTYI